MGEITPESVVVGPDGMPWWVSFEHSEDHSELSWNSFRFLADTDVVQFNRVFGTVLPTYEDLARSLGGSTLGEWYSPAYMGAGLRSGPLWNLGVGWGRWEFLLRRELPDVAGRRILEIGANNGHDALQMLRAGAKSVVGIEANRRRVEQGDFLKKAFEWADGVDYEYECLWADMRDIPDMELGPFDVVTAFCCLYYLSEPEMAELVRWLSHATPVMVVGCNEGRDMGRQHPDTYRRASLAFNVELLRNNGFPRIQVVDPPAYDRPLVIAHRA